MSARDEVTSDQIVNFLSEIANMARTVRTLCASSINATDDYDEQADLTAAARDIAGQIGWKADLALKRLGNPGVMGDAEAWMLLGGQKDAETVN